MIYLDSAATSNPKPFEVIGAVVKSMTEFSANPGRAGHSMANRAAREIFNARETIASFFNTENSQDICFTANITESLNLCLNGILKPGDHVITSSMEHNSMMRPLRALEENGIDVSIVKANKKNGLVDPLDIKSMIKSSTSLIAINHVSNVCGTIQPIKEIGIVAQDRKIPFLVDAAQSAGVLPIDVQDMKIDILAFTGHKSLYGPMGIGGCVVRGKVEPESIKPLKYGGTGSYSEFENQPDFMPDHLESGTPNLPGIMGLQAGVEWVKRNSLQNIYNHELDLTDMFIKKIKGIEEVEIVGIANIDSRTGVISIKSELIDCGSLAFFLDEDFDISTRAGLHCAPAAHKTLGTLPSGTLRFSIGCHNTKEEILFVTKAIKKIIKDKRYFG